MTTRRVPIIGIVGGISSGKSELARAFEALGCRRVQADEVGHEMLARADVHAELVTEFGDGIFGADGRVDRPRLAAVAFASSEATERLNAIVGGALWPEFRRRALEAADHAGADVQAVALDAALLFESDSNDLCDAVVFLDAPDDQRRGRVKALRGWDWEEVRRRELQQFPLSRKRLMADFVIQNDSTLSHLHHEARRILASVRERFFSRNKRSAGCARKDSGRSGSAN